jgi:hypothetical protein
MLKFLKEKPLSDSSTSWEAVVATREAEEAMKERRPATKRKTSRSRIC